MHDEPTILKAVCKKLEWLVEFKPPIRDANGNPILDVSEFDPPLRDKRGNPVQDLRDAYIQTIFTEINKEDSNAKPPPPKPRLAVFVDELKKELGHFFLEPQQL